MVKIIQDLLNVEEQIARYLLIVSLVAIVLIIVLFILVIIFANKYRKTNKESKNYKRQKDELALKLSDELLKQDKPVEEVNEEKVESQVEEAPAIEEKVEESEVEEVVVEEVKKVEEVTEEQNVETQIEETPTIEEEKVEEVIEEVEEEKPIKEELKEYEEESEEFFEERSARVLLGKYEIFPVKDAFLYRLKASNGEILVVSEMYKSAKGALTAIETVKKNIKTGKLQVSQDKHGLWQFKLLASNQRMLVVSANYTTQTSCERAANSFKKFAYISQIVELEEDSEHLFEEIELQALANKKGGKIIVSGSENEYEFKLLASNGAILCSSVTYGSKMAALNAISSFKEAIKTGTFYVVKDKNKMFQFKLYSTLGRCLAIGEAYKVKTQAVSAANSITAYINMAEVVDKTLSSVVER